MPFVLLKESVTLWGAHIPAGEVIELTEKSAASLVKEGKAAEATPDGETTAALGLEGQGVTSTTPSDEEAVERQTKALDDQYKKDELSKASKAIGVEFPYDATKPEIIKAVIEQGKADALLK